MTVIAAYTDSTHHWIGCDSAGSDDVLIWDYESKLIKKPNYTIGGAGSYRTGDLITEYPFFVEELRNLDDLREFRDVLKELMLEDGSPKESSSDDTLIHSVNLLMISPAGIFTLDADYQIHHIHIGYFAIGAGQQLALGSLMTSKALGIDNGEQAVWMACEAAIQYSTTCAGKCFTHSWPIK